MHDAVKDGFSKRAVVATELVVPSAGIVLGAEDRGGFLPSSVEQFQDVMLFRFRRLQSPPPVKRVARDAGYKPALLGCASRRWLSLSAVWEVSPTLSIQPRSSHIAFNSSLAP